MNLKILTKAVALFQRAQENARLQKIKKDMSPPLPELRVTLSPQLTS